MDKSQQAVEVFDSCADIYQEKYMDVSQYKASFDIFCNMLGDNAAILELGCGPGNITHYLLEKRPDFKILGTDLAPNMITLAKNNNPAAAFEIMDCREIGHLNQKFDAIMCGFCLPYLSKDAAIQLIRDAATILNTGGVIYISTMEDDYEKSRLQTSSSGEHTLFMYFHQADYLMAALETNDFTISYIGRVAIPGENAAANDLIIIAQNNFSIKQHIKKL